MTTFFTPKQSASLCSNSFGKKQGGMSKILGMKMLDFVRQLSASWCQKTEQVLLCDGLDGLHGRTVQWNEINFEVAFSFPLSWIDFFYYINTGNGKKVEYHILITVDIYFSQCKNLCLNACNAPFYPKCLP